MANDDLVELRKFTHVHEAELAISSLEAADIHAVLRDSSYGGIRVETLAHGITVLVRRDQRDTALHVLESAAEPRGTEEGSSSECASCGQPLQKASDACPYCSAEDHETVLTPARTRAAIGNLKLFVVFGALALGIIPVILRRLHEIETGAWVVAVSIVVGLAAAVFVLKILISSSDQRL